MKKNTRREFFKRAAGLAAATVAVPVIAQQITFETEAIRIGLPPNLTEKVRWVCSGSVSDVRGDDRA